MKTQEIEEVDEAGGVIATYVHSVGESGERVDVIVCKLIYLLEKHTNNEQGINAGGMIEC